MIGDGQVLPTSLVSEGAGQPTLSDAGRACQQQPMTLANPVAGGELEEERAVEPALGAEIDIFDLRVMTQLGGTGARLEPFLLAQCRFLLEKDGKPFTMVKAAGFRLGGEVLEAFGHAVKAEFYQHVEGGMFQHGFGLLLSGNSRDRAHWRDP